MDMYTIRLVMPVVVTTISKDIGQSNFKTLIQDSNEVINDGQYCFMMSPILHKKNIKLRFLNLFYRTRDLLIKPLKY